MRFLSELAAIVLASPIVNGMSGMGFTTMDGWPSWGVTHARIWDIGVTWRDIHVGVDTYDWDRLDSVVSQIESIGATITYVIGATPQWLAQNPNQDNAAPWLGPGSNSMPTDIDEFNKFCWSIANRYGGRIGTYEVWNEPQLTDFLYPYDDETLGTLAQMTKRAYSTIKSVSPSSAVLAASVCPRSSSGGMSKASKYLSAMKDKGWNVDGFTVHIYPDTGAGADAWHSMLVDAKSTISSFGPPNGGNVLVTETLYNLLGDVIPEDQAAGLVNSTYAYAQQEGVPHIDWYDCI